MNVAAKKPPKISPERLLREKERRELRKKCEENFFFFCDEIMRDHKNPLHLPLGRLHKDMCDHIQHETERAEARRARTKPGTVPLGMRALNLVPRSHLKSEILTVYYSAWRILRSAKIRILLVNEIDTNAEAFSSLLRTHFQTNDRLRYLAPELVPSTWGKVSAWNVNRVGSRLKDHTIEAIGVGSNAASRHFDLIIFDDFFTMEGEEGIDPKLKLIKAKNWFFGSTFLLDSLSSDMMVTGTRWHFDDPYNDMIKSGDWKVFFRVVEVDGVPSWPEKFPMDVIEAERKRFATNGQLGLWWAQYYNNPLPIGEAPLAGYNVYIGKWAGEPIKGYRFGVDPASRRKKTNDYTAFIVVGYTGRGDIVVELASQQRISPLETVERIFDIESLYNDQAPVGIETVAYQIMLADTVLDQIIRRGRGFPIIEVPRVSTLNKYDWIVGAIQPRVASGRLHVHESMIELIEQLDRYDKVAHEDLLDALASAIRLCPPVEELPTGQELTNEEVERMGLPRMESAEARMIRQTIEGLPNRNAEYDEFLGSEY